MKVYILGIFLVSVICSHARATDLEDDIDKLLDIITERENGGSVNDDVIAERENGGSVNDDVIAEQENEGLVQDDMLVQRDNGGLVNGDMLVQPENGGLVQDDRSKHDDDGDDDSSQDGDEDDLKLLERRLDNKVADPDTEEDMSHSGELPQIHTSYRCIRGNDDFYRTDRDAAIYSHNELRAKHGVPPLEWDEDLAVSAQEHAVWMAKWKLLEHSHGRYGENIAFRAINKKGIVFGTPPMFKSMYNEMISPGWNFTSSTGSGTGHFTQMVWKATKLIGCGLASVVDGRWERTYMCCQYLPAGNVRRRYHLNVLRPIVMAEATDADVDIDDRCDYYGKCSSKRYKRQCPKSDAIRKLCGYTCGL